MLAEPETRNHLSELAQILGTITLWDESQLDTAVREYADRNELKLGQVAQPLRAALTGSNVSPGIFEVMVVLGHDETLKRLELASS